MKILGLSLDADGCFYHLKYIYTVMLAQVYDMSVEDKKHMNELIVHDENYDILVYLTKLIRNFDQAFTYVGSYRQSHEVDSLGAECVKKTFDYKDHAFIQQVIEQYNLQVPPWFLMGKELTYSAPSFFSSIKVINDALEAQLCTLLMADIFGDLDEGTSFEKVKKEQDQHDNSDSNDQDVIIHAESNDTDFAKVTILYTQMHHLASKFPKDDISYLFIDDRRDILGGLAILFKANPDWIPDNVTLHLQRYAGDFPLEDALLIQGTGTIDTTYRETAKFMAMINRCFRPVKIPKALHAPKHITRGKVNALQSLKTHQPEEFKQNVSLLLIQQCLLRHAITQENRLDEVQCIIGKNPDLLRGIYGDGYTVLHLAVIFNRINMVEYFIEKRVNTNVLHKENGRSALDYAIAANHTPIISLLIKAGAKATDGLSLSNNRHGTVGLFNPRKKSLGSTLELHKENEAPRL